MEWLHLKGLEPHPHEATLAKCSNALHESAMKALRRAEAGRAARFAPPQRPPQPRWRQRDVYEVEARRAGEAFGGASVARVASGAASESDSEWSQMRIHVLKVAATRLTRPVMVY